MRSEDLSGIPESIEAWKVGELLEGLGFKPGSYKNVAEILIEPRSVTVKAYATDESGHRYQVDGERIQVAELGEKELDYVHGPSRAAMHTICIPSVGEWEKPIRSSGECRAVAVNMPGMLCLQPLGHEGVHTYSVDVRNGNFTIPAGRDRLA